MVPHAITRSYWDSKKYWTAFQINQPQPVPIADSKRDPSKTGFGSFSSQFWLEVLSVFASITLLVVSIAPGVNESHYLTKAKHYWNPGWCGDDIFLSSSDAHLFFFFSCGWPTIFLSLESVAWIGRITCWMFISWHWVLLNRSLGIDRWYSVVSAILFVLLIERFDMAGEWVIGGFEAKSAAYVFVIWAIRLLVDKRWIWFWPVIGTAIAFHAVVGIWALLCMMCAAIFELKDTDDSTSLSFEKLNIRLAIAFTSFLLFVAVGCLPPILSNWNTAVDVVQAANQIQVQERLNHHLLFGSFQILHVARFTFLVCLFLVIYRLAAPDRKLNQVRTIAIASLGISLAGMFLSGLAEHRGPYYDFANGLLRYYWFRFSDFAVPLAVALVVAQLTGQLVNSASIVKRRMAIASVSCLCIAAISARLETWGDWRSEADRQTLPTYAGDPTRTLQTYQNWKKVGHWIRVNTRNDAVFLTPYDFQTFKWYAHRTEFACWKDIPQDATSIVKWRERIAFLQTVENNIPGGVLGLEDQYLAPLVEENRISHILARQSDDDVISGDEPARSRIELRRVYPMDQQTKSTFVIYSCHLDQQPSNVD